MVVIACSSDRSSTSPTPVAPPRPAFTGTLSGTVRDNAGAPVAAASVYVGIDPRDGGTGGAQTDAQGRYAIGGLASGASWVNQIELFFSLVHRQCLRHGDFHSVAELRSALLGFIDVWNTHRAHPFRWSFTGYPLQAEEPLARPA